MKQECTSLTRQEKEGYNKLGERDPNNYKKINKQKNGRMERTRYSKYSTKDKEFR